MLLILIEIGVYLVAGWYVILLFKSVYAGFNNKRFGEYSQVEYQVLFAIIIWPLLIPLGVVFLIGSFTGALIDLVRMKIK